MHDRLFGRCYHLVVESLAHANLKRLASLYLSELGFVAIATEVRCPIARHVVDVAAFGRRSPVRGPSFLVARMAGAETAPFLFGTGQPGAAGRTGRPAIGPGSGARPARIRPITIFIECKQSRSDFLRERAELTRLLDARRNLETARLAIESDAIQRDPTIAGPDRGHLFPGILAGRLTEPVGRDHRRVLAAIDRLDARIHSGAKLSRMARYRLAIGSTS